MDKIVALCKRRGFVYPGSEIYGGLAGFWDYGPLGVILKNNLEKLWWKLFVEARDDMLGLDAAIIMNPRVWEVSGHVSGFIDLLESGEKFNVMFHTKVGAADSAQTSYLRPETAQGIFANFKNVVDSFHPKLPFGIGQIGKAFRNEIAPRDFVFRGREFEQMEVEYFVKENEWEKYFEMWREVMWQWLDAIGLPRAAVHELEVPDGERAHYSKRTIDFEFDFPFGRRELYGLAYRTDFDLSAHGLDYQDEKTGTRIIPHVIEPSLGLDRTMLAVLASAYTEDELGGEKRIYLKLNKNIAPIRVAVFPLLKNKPELVAKAREIYSNLKPLISNLQFDDNGNIGKRYRRQDEIGTPYCITVDFQTLDDGTVTLRARDTGAQERLPIADLAAKLA
ncbi:MAG: glycine--tRNA ligase [Candidatus Vogelbacteria bacterium]|nr:glycine--tRNA ligase [Candidatus Vogelbacteria bacterium]